ncbi:MAG: tetratricopeptide repeat protein [bacterium]
MHSQVEKQIFEKKTSWVWLAVLTILTFLVYLNTLSHEFLQNWDDTKYVTENLLIRGFTWKHLAGIFTEQFVGNYAPVQMLSYMIDYRIWGLNPMGFHLTNLLLHILNALLVFFLLFRFCRNRPASFIGALIFSIHPVQVESVAWISQRKNILSMSFFLASFLFYLRFLETHRRSAYAGSLTLFGAALLTKSVAVILPPILLLYHLIEDRPKRRFREILAYPAPFIVAAGAIAVVAVLTQQKGGGIREFYGGGPFATFLTVLTIHLQYLRMILFPVRLSALYDPPIQTTFFSPAVLPAVMVIGAIGLIFFRLYRKRSWASFWIGFYFIALLPVSQIIPIVTLMNDRYLYFPMVAVAGLISHLVVYFERIRKNSQTHRIVAAVTVSLLIGVLGLVLYNRNRVWENGLILWLDTVAKAPNNGKAHGGLGEIYMRKERFQEAERELSKSVELDPTYVEARSNLGFACMKLGKLEKAVTHLEEAVRLVPEDGTLRSDLASVYKEQGHLDEALIQLKKAVELDPENAEIRYNLAVFYTHTKRAGEAVEALEATLRLEPAHANALLLITLAYSNLGEKWKTEDLYLKAITASPDDYLLSYNLACFYATNGKPEEAIDRLRDALEKGMGDARILNEDPDLKALRARPDFKEIVNRMASLSGQQKKK